MNNYALITAAGTGKRLGLKIPKQYLKLNGKPMLYYSIKVFFYHKNIKKIYVILSKKDEWFSKFDWKRYKTKLIPLYCGSNTRSKSVFAGLNEIKCNFNDRIFVHDAARPCIIKADIDNLLMSFKRNRDGAILAKKITDTIKKSLSHNIVETIEREDKWLAETPQLFYYYVLINAFSQVDLKKITDEASAVESIGLSPVMIESNRFNLKVTKKKDIKLANLILKL